MAKYRAALIGCGARGNANAESYKHIANGVLTACCDPVAGRRDALAGKYGIKAYADARKMIEAESPDIVHVATMPDTRVELLTLASDLKVPLCTVEKPVACGVKDWKKLCALEASSATKFAVSHQFRWYVHLARCIQAMKGGKLGPVKFLDLSAGMNIANQGTHLLNYGMALIGDPQVKYVFGNGYGLDKSDPGHPAPESTEAYLIFENGVRALWTTGPHSMKIGDPGTTWQHVRATVYTEKGRVNWEEFGKYEIVSPDGAETGDYGGMEAWTRNNLLAQAAFHSAMFDWQEKGTVPGTNLKQSLHEWKTVLALYESTVRRGPVEMAGFDPDDDLFERLRAILK